MAEKYLFFNSTENDRRRYQASDMAEYWMSFLTDGFVRLGGKIELELTTVGVNRNVVLSIGRALIEGHLYINDSDLILQIENPDATLDRIDRVVLRFDNRIENQYIKAFVLKGEALVNPLPPELTRTADIHEISIAQVLVKAGKSFVEQSDIIDERTDPNVGGVSMVKSANNAMDMMIGDVNDYYDSNNVEDALDELKRPFNVYRSGLDEINNVYTIVEWKRANGSLYKKSRLSNVVNSNYTIQTVTRYALDGLTVLKTEVFALSYDANGNLQNEVKQ